MIEILMTGMMNHKTKHISGNKLALSVGGGGGGGEGGNSSGFATCT